MVVGVTKPAMPKFAQHYPIVEIPVLETAPTPEKSTKLETVLNPGGLRYYLVLIQNIQKTKKLLYLLSIFWAGRVFHVLYLFFKLC
jgi:hypothetical protein